MIRISREKDIFEYASLQRTFILYPEIYMAKDSSTTNREQPDTQQLGTTKAERMLLDAHLRAEAQLIAAKEEAANRLADAERRAMQLIDDAKSVALGEGNKIIEAAKEKAEAEVIKGGTDYGGDRIQRVIEFPPELKQAGIGILSYFSDVLKQRYPDQEMTVRIEQFGTKVRLTVDGPSGWQDTMEQDLETYGRVVVGQIPASSILSDEIDRLRLENKLQVAKVELDFEKRLNLLSQTQADGRIRCLESQIERLFAVLGHSLSQRVAAVNLSETLLQLDASSTVREALRTLQLQIVRQPSDVDRTAAAEALAAIKRDDPSVLSRLYDILSSTATGTAGNLLATLIQSLLK